MGPFEDKRDLSAGLDQDQPTGIGVLDPYVVFPGQVAHGI
jgi:hypothetical protein